MSTELDERRRAFEQIARKKGYDLERNDYLYANHVTNDLWTLYEAGWRARSPVQEAGPWKATQQKTGEHVIQSDDFEHDVMLRVTGDFSDGAARHAYVEELARRLNRASAGTVQPDGDVPYERTRELAITLTRVLDALGIEPSRQVVGSANEVVEQVNQNLASREVARLRYYRVLALVMEELGYSDRGLLLRTPEVAIDTSRDIVQALRNRPGPG